MSENLMKVLQKVCRIAKNVVFLIPPLDWNPRFGITPRVEIYARLPLFCCARFRMLLHAFHQTFRLDLVR